MDTPAAFRQRIQALPGTLLPLFEEAYRQPLRRGLRVNTGKISISRFMEMFPFPLLPSPFADNCFYVDIDLKAGSDPLHHAGAYYMQEPSATSAVAVLAPQPGEKVLDLCAAPGGKSTQIAAAVGNDGLLWSNEYVTARARILEQNLERMGCRRAILSNSDTGPLCEALPGYFDAVLVDAPCSGEGMFRKEPQALSGWSIDNIRLCAARQKEILHNASFCVRPGGRLVYSTCTFAPEENEGVVVQFLSDHPDFTLEPITVPWGSPGFAADDIRPFLPPIPCHADLASCRRIFPHQGGEGHFIALFRRQADSQTDAPAAYSPPSKDPHRQEAAELYASCFCTAPAGTFVTVGNHVRLLPESLPSLKGCGVLSAGIAVAEVCKNRLEPCHGVFAATPMADCRRYVDFLPDDPQLRSFLHGEELSYTGDKGWVAVAAGGLPVGFGKSAGGKLKNRYPKGLRLL